MRLNEIAKGKPSIKNDLEAKAWIVYNADGTEYSRHEYPALWNSSPASNAAKADLFKIENDAYRNRPLTQNEQEYLEIQKKFSKVMKFLKSAKEHPENTDPTSIRYAENFAKQWGAELDKLLNIPGNPIRDEVIQGTYK